MGGRPRIDGGGTTVAFEVPDAAPAAPARRALRPGMVVAEVVDLLGEPGLVTRGHAGREIRVWSCVASAMLEVDGPLGLLAGAGIRRANLAGTVTVVVRFDEMQQVSSVSVLACRT